MSPNFSVTGTTSGSLPGMAGHETPELGQQVQFSDEELSQMSWRDRRKAKKLSKQLKGSFEAYPHLVAIKPREKYVFRSDYFEVDNEVACILGFFHDDGATSDFAAFWGVSRIPDGLGKGVTAILLEQVHREPQKWVDDKLKNSERLDKIDAQEKSEGSTRTSRQKSAKVARDMDIVANEILNGAAYLHVHSRLFLRAPNIEALDAALERVRQLYIDRFSTLRVEPYHGEQRVELSTLLSKTSKKLGKGMHFTSPEFAGSYHLVTNGLNDSAGQYVGHMVGDVNSSAVLFDIDNWKHHVVVADDAVEPMMNRARYIDMWGSKISQSALLRNHRVVHIVLNGANLDALNPKMSRLTARLDMSKGDINMFEMFGKREDQLSVFPAHLEKLVLMAEQTYASTDADRSVIQGSLKETLTQFYIDKGMWYRNAKDNQDRLRVVGIPHDQIPRLQDIASYFDTQHKALSNKTARDNEVLHAYSVLRLLFRDLLDNNGDLFNTYTSSEIDGVVDARRVIYDFSSLLDRGKGIAMAQLVNVIGFAVSNLGLGDLLVIHGAENIDSRVKNYIVERLERLHQRGGRVAYLYGSIEKMLPDQDFNKFDAADWTLLGVMRDITLNSYRERMGQAIPPDLEQLITTRADRTVYLRRGYTNVVFRVDLSLGMNPALAEERKAAEDKALAMKQRDKPSVSRDMKSVQPVVSSQTGEKSSKMVPGLKKKKTAPPRLARR